MLGENPQASAEPPQASAEPPQACAEPPQESAEPPQACAEVPQESAEPPQACAEAPQESAEPPQACAEQEEPKAKDPLEKTSDYYRVSQHLPVRFNNPGWFRGYRTREAVSMYRTSNQAYGSRAPTVHEMPKVFYPYSNKFSRQLSATGMFQNNSFNVGMEKSMVTGPDNHITPCDRLNFHPSYNASKPSICD